jgi:hypothetical protein
MPTGFHPLLRIALINPLIASVSERKLLCSVQQFVRNAHIGRVGRRGNQRVRQTRLSVYANAFMPKCQRFPFLV